ncbi:MAG: radical SAM protein [Pirellulaceae bacterium]
MKTDFVIVWRVVEFCSLACPFCGFSREVARPRGLVPTEWVIHLADVLRRYVSQRNRNVLLSWLGGEPLEWPGLTGLADACGGCPGLQLGITTHGRRLVEPQVRRELLARYHQVTVSIDGPEDFHDRLRGMKGLHRQVQAGVRQLRSEDPQRRLLLRVNCVLMRDNIDSFDVWSEELAHWGFDELTFNQLGGVERPEFYAAHRLLPEQVTRFVERLPALRERLGGLGLAVLGNDQYLRRIDCSARGASIPLEDCEPGARFLFLDGRGLVSPCSFTAQVYGIPVTEIRSPDDLDQLPARFSEMRRTYRHSACFDCHATHVFDKFMSLPSGLTPPATPGDPHDRKAVSAGVGSPDQPAGPSDATRI